jgi:transposase-like protein
MKFTDKQKRAAVKTYLAEGATAAAQATGCSRQAVYGWLALYGVDSVNDQEKRQATADRHAQKRAALAEAFLDQSMTLALAADPAQPLEAQRLMTAAAIASQKHLELIGRAPASPPVITQAWLEMEISRMEGELGKVAPSSRSADSSAVDRELARVVDEFRRQSGVGPSEPDPTPNGQTGPVQGP